MAADAAPQHQPAGGKIHQRRHRAEGHEQRLARRRPLVARAGQMRRQSCGGQADQDQPQNQQTCK
jgi:hypothetical protein